MFLIRHITDRAEDFEAVATFVDDFLHGRRASDNAPIGDEEVASITHILNMELHGVEPVPEFVESLRIRLIAAADQRVPMDEPAVTWRQPALLIGAASLVSAAAVIAFVARSRMPHRPAA